MKSAILLHTSGFDARMSMTWEMYQEPYAGSQFGCSVYASGAVIQETSGRRPASTSARKSASSASGSRPCVLTSVPVLALSASGVPGCAFWYWWK
jgi:hypothetical protein